MPSVEQGIPKLNHFVDKLHQLNPIEKLRLELMTKQHPYGLLLMLVPLISVGDRSTTYQLDASGMVSSSLLINSSFDTSPGKLGKLIGDVSSAGALGLSFSGQTQAASLSSAGLALSLMSDKKDRFHMPIAVLSSVLGVSAGANPSLANILRNSCEFTLSQTEAMVVPLLASVKQTEFNSFSGDRTEIGVNRLRVGSVVAKVCVYIGREPYIISSGALPEPYTVNPGDKILVLHVNQGGEEYAKMEPLGRIKKIKHHFQQLCKLLEKPNQFDLTEEQRQQIEVLREAPLIGLSHLVRLLAARGLPTWDIKLLPSWLQKLHAFDSQLVSRLFGGVRSIDLRDIRLMFLPASMRNQVMA